MDGFIAYALSKKYADEVGRSILDAGLKTQIERDRSILQTIGQEKILYFIPKTTAKPSDGYDEYVYSNNAWERVGTTDIDLSSYATKAEIPKKTSELQNDSGFLTQHQDISGKADKATTLAGYGITDAYTKSEVDMAVGSKTISSAAVNNNGTITFTLSNGSAITTTGTSVIGPQGPAGANGQDYNLTAQDKSDIAALVLAQLPTTQGVQYGN